MKLADGSFVLGRTAERAWKMPLPFPEMELPLWN
jgi:hypothetical protein